MTATRAGLQHVPNTRGPLGGNKTTRRLRTKRRGVLRGQRRTGGGTIVRFVTRAATTTPLNVVGTPDFPTAPALHQALARRVWTRGLRRSGTQLWPEAVTATATMTPQRTHAGEASYEPYGFLPSVGNGPQALCGGRRGCIIGGEGGWNISEEPLKVTGGFLPLSSGHPQELDVWPQIHGCELSLRSGV